MNTSAAGTEQEPGEVSPETDSNGGSSSHTNSPTHQSNAVSSPVQLPITSANLPVSMTSHANMASNISVTTTIANNIMRRQDRYRQNIAQPLTNSYLNLRQQLQQSAGLGGTQMLQMDYMDNQGLSAENPIVKIEPPSNSAGQMHGYGLANESSRSPSVDHDDHDGSGLNGKNNPTLMQAHMSQARGDRPLSQHVVSM